MPNFNKVILIGHLTSDPEIKNLQGGSSVTSFGIAVNSKWKSRQGEVKEDIMFIDCAAFGRTAEFIYQYFNKGSAALVEGKLKLDQWQDKDGNRRSKHKVSVDNVSFAGGPKGQKQSGDDDGAGDNGVPF